MIDKDTILSNWDLSTVPSPCYVLHETLLADNLRVIDKVRKATGAEIIVALKANAMWSIFSGTQQTFGWSHCQFAGGGSSCF